MKQIKLLPSDGSYHRIVVGIALLAYAASERMKAAGAENIINADAYTMALIRGTIAPQTTFGKAVAQTHIHCPIDQRHGQRIKITYRYHWIRRLANSTAHLLHLFAAQLAGLRKLAIEGTFFEMSCGERVEAEVRVFEFETLQMIDNQAKGVAIDHYVALTADVGHGLVAYRLLVDERIAREDYIAKLTAAVVVLEVVIGIGILVHYLAQFGQSEALSTLIHQHLL